MKRRLLSFGLALMLMFGMLVPFGGLRVSAESSADIKEQLEELEAQNSALQEKMDELEAQKNQNLTEMTDMVQQKDAIDQQIGLLHFQISNINEQISTYSQLIADKQEELEKAEARYADLSEKNRLRIRAMEEDGELSYWSVLFQANSFADFLDRLNMIAEIAEADQRRMEELNKAAKQVSVAREQLAVQKEEMEVSKLALQDSQEMLSVRRAEADAVIAQLIAQGEEYQALMDDYEDQEEDLLADIAEREPAYNDAKEEERQAILAAQQAQKPAGGGSGGSGYVPSGSSWMVPCSYVYVSSPYGYRIHPIHGYTIFHSGIDLAAYEGVPIYASRGGTVTTATYDGAAGYYVTINHGDGFSSSYLHMTHYIVGPGDVVSQGQVIGYVGSTGGSTGPHLHFSIYYNGSSVNPANYINF